MLIGAAMPLINMGSNGEEAGSKRLRRFLVALRRCHPLLVLRYDQLLPSEDSPSEPALLVVTDTSQDWGAVDRLSDGVIELLVFNEEELRLALRQHNSPVRSLLEQGKVLFQREGERERLLAEASNQTENDTEAYAP